MKLEIIEDFNFSFDPEKIQRFLTRKKSFFLIFLKFFFLLTADNNPDVLTLCEQRQKTMAPLLDPDKQRRAYDRSCSSLNTTPKKTLFWLLLSLHILSCLSQKSNSDQIHEIFHDDLEHSIVRRDVSSDGGSQAQEVSKLALATRLNSSHLHLMVHWAGQGSPVIFVLARSQVMDSKANSKVYISRDYGKTFHEKSELFQVSTNAEDGKTSTNAVIAKFYHHPQSNCHYVFADTVNR